MEAPVIWLEALPWFASPMPLPKLYPWQYLSPSFIIPQANKTKSKEDASRRYCQDYFTNKVYSVGKSDPGVTSHREILYGPLNGF